MEEIARMWKNFWMLFTSNKVRVLVGEPIFWFDNYEHWSDKKYFMYRADGSMRCDRYVCMDTSGRICSYSRHFRRAQADDCYPVTVYEVL